MRGLAILAQRGVTVEAVARYRGIAPVRTEADAWRDTIRDRRERGLPLTFDEFKEAGEAFKREKK